MYSSLKRLVEIARSLRVLVDILIVLFAMTAVQVIFAKQALADHTWFPVDPTLPTMSESYRDEPVNIGVNFQGTIIDHTIGGIGGHVVFAKTVLTNPNAYPEDVVCELHTTGGNFDTVTVTIPPRSSGERDIASDGEVSVSLQAIDQAMPSIAHFGRLTCSEFGTPDDVTASMSKVWAIAVQHFASQHWP